MRSARTLFATPAALLALVLMVAGCGLQPMYAGGEQGAIAQGMAAIDVPPISGKAGWLMHNALVDRLHAAGSPTTPARYRLDVRLDDKLEGLGLLANNTVGRERRTLRARYQLVDVATGRVLLDATAGSDAGIDVVSSEYATVAGEETAMENLIRIVADRIVIKLSLQLRSGNGAGG
jgi:LPS-assembly lipoprotein